jgi:hypothetical protein
MELLAADMNGDPIFGAPASAVHHAFQANGWRPFSGAEA